MMTRSRDKIATVAQLGKQAHDRKLKLTRNTKMSENPKIFIFETFFKSAYSNVIFQKIQEKLNPKTTEVKREGISSSPVPMVIQPDYSARLTAPSALLKTRHTITFMVTIGESDHINHGTTYRSDHKMYGLSILNYNNLILTDKKIKVVGCLEEKFNRKTPQMFRAENELKLYTVKKFVGLRKLCRYYTFIYIFAYYYPLDRGSREKENVGRLYILQSLSVIERADDIEDWRSGREGGLCSAVGLHCPQDMVSLTIKVRYPLSTNVYTQEQCASDCDVTTCGKTRHSCDVASTMAAPT
ncbi:hypothetical protein GQR58_027162 [Nymphon striatum]|nr:hypothetical protein GQR58_027162 [Nymphon striatum]